MFVRLLPRLCPAAEAFANKPIREKIKDVPGLKSLFVQLAVDNGINNPILYFPIFYTVKEFIEGGDLKDGIKKYKTHFKEDVIAIWKVWCLLFIVPLQHSIHFTSGRSRLNFTLELYWN